MGYHHPRKFNPRNNYCAHENLCVYGITPEPTDVELECLYNELSGKSAILSLVPGFCNEYISQHVKRAPFYFHSLHFFDEEMLEVKYPRLLDVCKTFDNIKITADQAKKLKEMTQEQSKSKLWFKH